MLISRAEQARRKDIHQTGVAQEALDVLEALAAKGWSSSEAFTTHGYSLSHVCKPALREEERILSELAEKPLAEVESSVLAPADVKTKYNVPDYVGPKQAPESV